MTIYEREVLRQPAALARGLAAYTRPRKLLRLFPLDSRPSSLLFLGMGSSLFAAHPAVCYLAARGLQAQAQDAGEFLHYGGALQPATLLALISQSGESPEVNKIASRLGRRPFAVITNHPASSLAKAGTVTLPILGGRECGTTNQTFTNTIVVCLALAAAAAGEHPAALLSAARRIPNAMRRFLQGWRERLEPIADFLGFPTHLDLIARGPSLAAARQGALILRELCHLKTAAHSAGQFRHGLLPSLREGGAVIVLAPRGATQSLVLRLARDIEERGAQTVLVTDAQSPRAPMRRAIVLPATGELFAPLLSLLPLQLFGVLWAERRGMEPGEGIEKITTRE